MLIPSGFVGLITVAGLLTDNSESKAPPTQLAAVDNSSTTIALSEYFQPVIEGRGDAGPFWQTTFAVVVPDDHWEGVDSPLANDNLCKPVAEESYRLTNDRGVLVAAYDQAQTLVFDRAASQVVDGGCRVEVVTMGDYQDDLGNSYLLTNGALQATFTPEQLFSGQDAGPDSTLLLTPVAGAQQPGPDPSTTAPAATTVTTAPPTTATPTTAPPTTRPPTTAAPTTTRPPTTQAANYANCDAARAAGVTPLHRGDPGYSSKLDRDGDGVACE